MKTRNKIIIAIGICIGIIAIGFISFGIIVPLANKADYKIYSTLTDFSAIKNSEITEDKSVADFNIIESACFSIIFNSKEYKVYAHLFDTNEEAKKYFKKDTNQDFNGTTSFHSSGNIYFANSRIAIYRNKTLKISGGYYPDFIKFVNYLNEFLQGEIIKE